MNSLGYYTSARSDHPDARILDSFEEQFGSQLEALTGDDKASLLICLVETATNPQQVLIEPNFFTNQNGGEAWLLTQQLSSGSQLKVALALLNQIIYGGQ